MTRDVRKSVRMSDDELKIIMAKAKTADMKFSEYVRQASLEHTIVVVPGIKELHLQVAKIGNNLNQLTVLCHQGMITCPNIDNTREMISEIYNKLSEISEVISSGDNQECNR